MLARLLAVALALPVCTALTLLPVNLTTNWLPPGHLAPFALPELPVFRFQVAAQPAAARGIAWEATAVQVCSSASCTGADTVTCTAPGASAAALTCPAPAYAQPSALLFWRVRLQAGGAWGAYSAPASFGTALGAGPGVVGARWLAAPRALTAGNASRPVRARADIPLLGSPITRAVLYIAAPGLYRLSCAGQPASTHEYGPLTEYTKRVLYTAHDVTACVGQGAGNLTLGLRLGGGYWGHAPAFSAESLPFRAQLHLEAAAGAPARVLTELPWLAALDALSFSDFYLGEASSGAAEAAMAGWDGPGFHPTAPTWQPVQLDASPALAATTLSPHDLPFIATYATLAPVALTQPQPGLHVFAFPVNFAGVPLVSVPSPAAAAGSTVQLYAGELLFADGTVYNQLNGSTLQVLAHTLAGGGGQELLRPTFAFWGFQYLAITGWPAAAPAPTLASVTGYAMATQGEQSGFLSFDGVQPSHAIAHSHVPPAQAGRAHATAAAAAAAQQQHHTSPAFYIAQELARSAAVNASVLAGVQALTLGGTRSNFFSVPSDCPTREKRGWMGDGASSVGQAARNYFWPGAYAAWLRSMRDDQLLAPRVGSAAEGVLSVYVPRDRGVSMSTDAAWALAAGEVLWQTMQVYGVEAQALAAGSVTLDALLAFFKRQIDPSKGIMQSQAMFGDWCANFDRVAYVNVTKDICATASHMLLLDTGAAVATLLNRSSAAQSYAALRAASAAPFARAYATQQGSVWTDGLEQTPALMPLLLGFAPNASSSAATAAWLVHDIEVTQGGHWSTGSVGTRFVLGQLDALGRADLAAFLAAQDTFPSPGWWLRQGATTGWESWSGAPGGDPSHPPPPTHNHPFLLAHGLWVWEGLLGLRIASGAREVMLLPPLLADLPAAAGSWLGPLGRVEASWAWAGAPAASGALLRLTLPPGTARGVVRVPLPGWGAATGVVREGGGAGSGTVLWQAGAFVPGAVAGVTQAVASSDGQAVLVTLSGSGEFFFSSAGPAAAAAAAAASPRRAQCAPWAAAAAGGSINLTCASAASPTVLRAGLFASAAKGETFLATGRGLVGGAASLRFTITHTLQEQCKAGQCSASRGAIESTLAAQGVALQASDAAHNTLCAEWLCPS